MNSRLLLTTSALLLAVIGIAFTFLPEELLRYFQLGTSQPLLLLFQLLGALYFGFAILNWMVKDSVIGGIYNRPIALANFAHFLIGALALVKAVLKMGDLPLAIYILTDVYVLLALLYGVLFSRNPTPKRNTAIS